MYVFVCIRPCTFANTLLAWVSLSLCQLPSSMHVCQFSTQAHPFQLFQIFPLKLQFSCPFCVADLLLNHLIIIIYAMYLLLASFALCQYLCCHFSVQLVTWLFVPLTEQWQRYASALCCSVWPLPGGATATGGVDRPHHEEQQVWDSPWPGGSVWPPGGSEAFTQRPSQPALLQHQATHATAPGLAERTPVCGGGAAGRRHGH